ncbi:mitochondrial carrier protein-like protein [Piedraia hortae CBS 480.64]|uniref:Mitochondrial carrier protein-like protein n=1 Tax=Piedraia hortae CBS 480.64 TaxID=1314780 RepID=A0A6A7BS07_9PEZI|nr:mitochondrial carrier protein-like protein [Piedraia hortae CBS 480.64]
MSQTKSTDVWIAGATAAFTVDLIVYPLDTIKTRLQSPDYAKRFRGSGGINRSLFHGVYQGVGSAIIATLPSSGAFFTTYETIQSRLEKLNARVSNRIPQPLIYSLASGCAELVSCAILTPAEVIKQNAQMVDNSNSNRPKTNATLATLKKFRSNPAGLWRGYAALAGRNLPFTALQFPLYERLKAAIKRYRYERGLRTNTITEAGLITAFSAGAGGAIAALITTPVDVIKTRIMLAAADESVSSKPSKRLLKDATGAAVDAARKPGQAVRNMVQRKGMLQVAREVMQEMGFRGLFRGGPLRAIWTLVGSGLYLGVYESGKMYLAQRRPDVADEDI